MQSVEEPTTLAGESLSQLLSDLDEGADVRAGDYPGLCRRVAATIRALIGDRYRSNHLLVEAISNAELGRFPDGLWKRAARLHVDAVIRSCPHAKFKDGLCTICSGVHR